jgi:peptidoglycan pentaglycine glycine transferase (the first glycine)
VLSIFMEDKTLNFIQLNSPDGGFLQSEYWRKFQENVGRETHTLNISDEDGELIAFASVIEHTLPLVGKYFYVPRGPIINQKSKIKNKNDNVKIKIFSDDLLKLSKENNTGWIRIEPNSEEDLKLIEDNLPAGIKVRKSAVDIQSREILVMDISGSEEEILARMKQKTRYNIRLAEKRGVHVSHNTQNITHNINEFLKLVKITAKRDGITAHPENYYRKMFETIPSDILKLYIAEYEGKVIVANLVLFFGNTATYMHGASDNEHRNVMAPYLLQWQQIVDAKKTGCERYDFGGIKIGLADNSWSGITKFKTGFAPETKPVEFPGCYDIILNPIKYSLYRLLRKIKP